MRQYLQTRSFELWKVRCFQIWFTWKSWNYCISCQKWLCLIWEVLRLFLSWLCFGDVQHGYDFSIDVSSEVHSEPQKSNSHCRCVFFLLVFVEPLAQKTVQKTLFFQRVSWFFWFLFQLCILVCHRTCQGEQAILVKINWGKVNPPNPSTFSSLAMSMTFGGMFTPRQIGVSLTGIFTYVCHKNQLNVGKYTIHGSYGWFQIMTC